MTLVLVPVLDVPSPVLAESPKIGLPSSLNPMSGFNGCALTLSAMKKVNANIATIKINTSLKAQLLIAKFLFSDMY